MVSTANTANLGLTKIADSDNVSAYPDVHNANLDIIDGKSAIVITGASFTFSSDSTYSDFPYKGTYSNSKVTASMWCSVNLSLTLAVSGDYAPYAETASGKIYIWSKKSTAITADIVVIP